MQLQPFLHICELFLIDESYDIARFYNSSNNAASLHLLETGDLKNDDEECKTFFNSRSVDAYLETLLKQKLYHICTSQLQQ